MRVRLGYVAIALGLPKVTSSSNVTYTYYQRLSSEEDRISKLKQVTYSNILALKDILEYNVNNNIHFYRITSALVPLATHPDQFNVINSVERRVVKNTEHNLWFHANLFKDLDYPLGKVVLHVGSGAGGKEKSIERFKENFKSYPVEITSKIILENDDKTFTARDTLELCKDLDIPMVLDVHHHLCNNEGEDIKELLGEIFHTWSQEDLPPKLHFSSPKDSPTDRRHADYIDAKEFVGFIESCREFDTDIDIMIEAKMKDLALFDLVESIRTIRKDFEWIDNSTFKL